MAVNVVIEYSKRKGSVDIWADDKEVTGLNYINEKSITEWFTPVQTGRVVWKGFILELQNIIASNDIKYDFISDTESQELFFKCLLGDGVNIEESKFDVKVDAVKTGEQYYQMGMSYKGKNDLEAFKNFSLSAEKDCVDGQYELALCMLNGLGCQINEPDGTSILENLSKQNYNLATQMIEQIEQEKFLEKENENYYKALVCIENEQFDEAKKLLKRYKRSNNIDAKVQLANLYYKDLHQYSDGQEPNMFDLVKDAPKDNQLAQLLVGVCFIKGKFGIQKYYDYEDYEEESDNILKGVQLLESLAEQNFIEAQLELSDYYWSYDEDEDEDMKKALYWLERAASLGSSRAQSELEEYYEDLEEETKQRNKDYENALLYIKHEKYKEAYDLLEQFEDSDNIEAKVQLAYAFFKINGYGGYYGGIFYLVKDAPKDNQIAQLLLAMCYLDEDFGMDDYDDTDDYDDSETNKLKGMEMLENLANQNIVDAQITLGSVYYDDEDFEKAWYWLDKSMLISNEEFILEMSQDFESDHGYKSAQWLEIAASKGSTEAKVRLGGLYGEGYHVTQDIDKAIKWYELASSEGSGKAEYELGSLYDNNKIECFDDETRIAKTIQHYEKALKLGYDPSYPNIKSKIDKLKNPSAGMDALSLGLGLGIAGLGLLGSLFSKDDD